MENKGYLIYEVGILGGNDKVKTNLFVLFVLSYINIMITTKSNTISKIIINNSVETKKSFLLIVSPPNKNIRR